MDTEARKIRLKTLVGELLTRYELSHHSCNHICFNIKPKDVKFIVDNYKDVLETSNLYISPAGLESYCGFNYITFQVNATDIYFGVSSVGFGCKERFEYNVRTDYASNIEIDISCETILSFNFTHADSNKRELISFRNDYQ